MLGESGSIYLGGNIEVQGESAALCVHAEQCAASLLYANREKAVRALAVTAAPCGHCRQFLYELVGKSSFEIHLAARNPIDFQSLLPFAYGPEELGVKQPALPPQPSPGMAERGWNDAEQAALNALVYSYAPYTKALSGVSLRAEGGRVFAGSYIENCAFNPSLPPMQAALANLVMSGLGPATVTHVTLVELGKAKISQVTSTRVVMRSLCPKASLSVRQVTAI